MSKQHRSCEEWKDLFVFFTNSYPVFSNFPRLCHGYSCIPITWLKKGWSSTSADRHLSIKWHVDLTSCHYNFPLCVVQTSPRDNYGLRSLHVVNAKNKKTFFFFHLRGRKWQWQRVDRVPVFLRPPITFLGLSTAVSPPSLNQWKPLLPDVHTNTHTRTHAHAHVAGSVHVRCTCLSFYCTD